MDLIFTKDFFQSGSNRFGVLFHESSGYENFGWLAVFLMDDGGMGVKHLLEMSETLLKEILEEVPNGSEVEQYREHFGVIVGKEMTKIDSLLTDEIVVVMPTRVHTKYTQIVLTSLKLTLSGSNCGTDSRTRPDRPQAT